MYATPVPITWQLPCRISACWRGARGSSTSIATSVPIAAPRQADAAEVFVRVRRTRVVEWDDVVRALQRALLLVAELAAGEEE